MSATDSRAAAVVDGDGRRNPSPPSRYADVNAVVGGYLRDLAFAQSSQQKMFGYKRAAAAILALDVPLTDLVEPDGALPRISGIGPGSTRVIREILETGESPTVERAIEGSDRRADIERRRRLRRHFLSRAEVRRVLADPAFEGPGLEQYRGDLQMHSEWSDGHPTVQEIADACRERGYQYAAVTDHSYGLKIAGGMSMAEAAEQRTAIDQVNARHGDQFRLLQGVEANIDIAGRLDLTDEEAATFDVVLAAPHSRLRKDEDQTNRMLTAVAQRAVRILAHPRGRITGSRAGVVAQWNVVFAAAAERGVAIELDGDPARQDLDYSLAAEALGARCLFALDSDAHTTGQLAYAETAIAQARLAGIPPDRIVNCWPLDRLLAWLSDPLRERLVSTTC
jgi:histidinol phosphatase-like PHP family hydrolase